MLLLRTELSSVPAQEEQSYGLLDSYCLSLVPLVWFIGFMAVYQEQHRENSASPLKLLRCSQIQNAYLTEWLLLPIKLCLWSLFSGLPRCCPPYCRLNCLLILIHATCSPYTASVAQPACSMYTLLHSHELQYMPGTLQPGTNFTGLRR